MHNLPLCSFTISITGYNNAAVLLGLMPTVLSMAGTTTIEAGVLALRRPILALLLSAGSPAVSPLRTFDYRDPIELLQIRDQSGDDLFTTVTNRPVFTSLLEYALASAATANLAHTVWQLSYRTICSVCVQLAYLPVMWAFIAVPVHMAGMVAVANRVRLVEDETPAGDAGNTQRKASWPSTLGSSLKQELQPSSSQTPADMVLRKESLTFMLASWLTSTATIAHLLFGIVVLSGTLSYRAETLSRSW